MKRSVFKNRSLKFGLYEKVEILLPSDLYCESYGDDAFPIDTDTDGLVDACSVPDGAPTPDPDEGKKPPEKPGSPTSSTDPVDDGSPSTTVMTPSLTTGTDKPLGVKDPGSDGDEFANREAQLSDLTQTVEAGGYDVDGMPTVANSGGVSIEEFKADPTRVYNEAGATEEWGLDPVYTNSSTGPVQTGWKVPDKYDDYFEYKDDKVVVKEGVTEVPPEVVKGYLQGAGIPQLEGLSGWEDAQQNMVSDYFLYKDDGTPRTLDETMDLITTHSVVNSSSTRRPPQLPPHLVRTDKALIKKMGSGDRKEAMEAFSQLSPEEQWNVVNNTPKGMKPDQVAEILGVQGALNSAHNVYNNAADRDPPHYDAGSGRQAVDGFVAGQHELLQELDEVDNTIDDRRRDGDGYMQTASNGGEHDLDTFEGYTDAYEAASKAIAEDESLDPEEKAKRQQALDFVYAERVIKEEGEILGRIEVNEGRLTPIDTTLEARKAYDEAVAEGKDKKAEKLKEEYEAAVNELPSNLQAGFFEPDGAFNTGADVIALSDRKGELEGELDADKALSTKLRTEHADKVEEYGRLYTQLTDGLAQYAQNEADFALAMSESNPKEIERLSGEKVTLTKEGRQNKRENSKLNKGNEEVQNVLANTLEPLTKFVGNISTLGSSIKSIVGLFKSEDKDLDYTSAIKDIDFDFQSKVGTTMGRLQGYQGEDPFNLKGEGNAKSRLTGMLREANEDTGRRSGFGTMLTGTERKAAELENAQAEAELADTSSKSVRDMFNEKDGLKA